MICNEKGRISLRCGVVDHHLLAQPLAHSWDTKVATTHAKEATTRCQDRQCNTRDMPIHVGQRRGIKDTSRPIASPRASQVLPCKGCGFEIRKSCFFGVWPSSVFSPICVEPLLFSYRAGGPKDSKNYEDERICCLFVVSREMHLLMYG
jgi:hypothetical protein